LKLIAYLKQWWVAHKEHRIDRLTAKAADLKENQQYDLLFLHKRGFVRAKGSGQSITKIYADVENKIRKTLRVVVEPGTYFISSGGHQDMATTTQHEFTLYPCATRHLGIDAVCINANRPIPSNSDKFQGIARVSDKVARFLEASRGEDPMVIQAGVWTLTDNYSRYDIINHLISRDSSGNTWHPIKHEHCDRAKAVLEELGIDHRLWYSDIKYEKKTVEYENGSYTGEFRYGEQHGRGKYVWEENGSSYEGEWKNGKFHGEGVRIYEDGGKYIGKFEEGREVGGWYHFTNGNRVWCYRDENGEWVNASTDRESGGETGQPMNSESSHSADNHYHRALALAAKSDWPHAFEELKEAVNQSHPEAKKMLATAWCPNCRTQIREPSTQSISDYARFWRGRCPKCECQFQIRQPEHEH
jgi:hypothetical protein